MMVRRSTGWAVAAMGLVALAAETAGAQAAGSGATAGDPWAIGYAVQVARTCPAWEVERQETLAARGILPKPPPGSVLFALDGPFQRGIYRGQADANADSRGRADFCRNLRTVAGARWPRLARVLKLAGARSRATPPGTL